MSLDEGGRPELIAPTPVRVQVAGHERSELGDWQAAACDPDACSAPAEAEGLDWIAAAVPGTAAAAARAAGRWEIGEERDFDAEDWWFRTRFTAPEPGPDEEVVLCLGGVATNYEVFLDGELLHAGASMWEAVAIDLGGRLRAEGNELAIRCRALGPLLRVRRKPRARWRTKLADNALRFQRTMLLGRCPGFAPGPAAVGPWRPVWIERRRKLVVESLELRPRVEGEDGVVAVRGRLRGLGAARPSSAELIVAGGEATATLELRGDTDGSLELAGEARLAGAERWWPHTHGEPRLYEVALRVAGEGWEADVESGRLGFRQLCAGAAPDHDPVADGLDLHLNGVRVFARGAVWTPVDPVGLAPPREELRAMLELIREAGMNCVRIPGTGSYEEAGFHDLCDELGILVWQDFMFANFDYPIADAGFRAAVESEARSQLAALAGRPSLAVLCGNSEVEQQVAMLGLDPELGRGELFGELLPGLAAEASDAIYVPSSPCGGELPFRPNAGIANYFGVGGYRRPLSDARLAEVKFAGECLAVANVPDAGGVEVAMPLGAGEAVVHHPRWKAGVPRDADTGWDFDDVRDHYLGELFGLDPGELRRYDHERYLELSRAVSGELMAAVFGEWRRGGSPCGGGLVLWWRDLVPGAGWGLVDSGGTPKPALWRLRAALAPIAVWFTDEGLNGIALHAANDRPNSVSARLRVGCYRDFETPVGEAERPIEIGPHGTLSCDLESVLGHFADVSWAYRFGPPAQDVVVASLEPQDGGGALSRALYFPAGRPALAEAPARLGIEATIEPAGEDLLVRLRSRRLVHSLELAAAGYTADAARGLSLEPGRETSVRLVAEPGAERGATLRLSALNLAGKMSFPIPAAGAA